MPTTIYKTHFDKEHGCHTKWEYLVTSTPFGPVIFGERKLRILPSKDISEMREKGVVCWLQGDANLIARPYHSVPLCFNDTAIDLDWLFENNLSLEITFSEFVEKFETINKKPAV